MDLRHLRYFVAVAEEGGLKAAEAYLERSGVRITPHLEIDNFAMAISLVGSTGGVALLPASIGGYSPASIVSRPLGGEQPTTDLVARFHRANRSAVLEKFLSRLSEFSGQVRGSAARTAGCG